MFSAPVVFDLAIRVGPLADSTLTARKLGELHYGLFVAPGYLARYGAPTEPSELQTHDTLVFSGGNHQGMWVLSRDRQQKSITLEPRLKANNVFAVRDAPLPDTRLLCCR
jgi:DNA-binding transcriptional LysR family regulator